jgi:2-polyprenyl-3-methyl-5-hydroxy-6-metoxy-1,4-benzoquinol methylase
LYLFSEGKGISRYDEVVLDIGTGHGILYEPLDEWISPAVIWANHDAD